MENSRHKYQRQILLLTLPIPCNINMKNIAVLHWYAIMEMKNKTTIQGKFCVSDFYLKPRQEQLL